MNPMKWCVKRDWDGGWLAYPPSSFDGVWFRQWRSAWDYACWAARRV